MRGADHGSPSSLAPVRRQGALRKNHRALLSSQRGQWRANAYSRVAQLSPRAMRAAHMHIIVSAARKCLHTIKLRTHVHSPFFMVRDWFA